MSPFAQTFCRGIPSLCARQTCLIIPCAAFRQGGGARRACAARPPHRWPTRCATSIRPRPLDELRTFRPAQPQITHTSHNVVRRWAT